MAARAWNVIGMQSWREIVRFFRQRSRVVGAAGQPLVFWLLFGIGLQGSFRPGGAAGASYLQYFFPGTLVLVLLFTAIFATISIIEDRREGFLQSVLVAPVPRWQMVLGKVLGGAAIAVAQCLLVLLLGWAVFPAVPSAWPRLLPLTALLSVSALALTSLGFVIAWRMESTHGFHAIMNLFLMPMWLLSGAFFPAPGRPAASWSEAALHWVMRCNPLSYCVSGARQLMYGAGAGEGLWAPSLAACWIVTLVFAAGVFQLACWTAAQRTQGDLI